MEFSFALYLFENKVHETRTITIDMDLNQAETAKAIAKALHSHENTCTLLEQSEDGDKVFYKYEIDTSSSQFPNQVNKEYSTKGGVHRYDIVLDQKTGQWKAVELQRL